MAYIVVIEMEANVNGELKARKIPIPYGKAHGKTGAEVLKSAKEIANHWKKDCTNIRVVKYPGEDVTVIKSSDDVFDQIPVIFSV